MDSSTVDTARPLGRATAKNQQKGLQTRAAILDAALSLASHMGLEGLSIGALAEVTQMSKSGVFAHFGSREELQIAVVREYHARFEAEVFAPAMLEARGLPRLRALFERGVRRWPSSTASRIARASAACQACTISASASRTGPGRSSNSTAPLM